MGTHRDLKRRHLLFDLKVFDRDSHTLVGHMVDVTTRGMMVVSETALSVDREYRLQLGLPPGLRGGDRWDMTARSVWTGRDANPALHGAGLKFVGFTRRDEQLLQDLIDTYALND